MELIETNNKRIYKCDVCGKVENWNTNWQWWGSYKDAEDGNPILCICSKKCRGNMTYSEAKNLLEQKIGGRN